MAVDSRAFRDTLSRFASGVSVVAAPSPQGGAVGVTITSFASLSLDPPLVLFCIDRGSANFAVLVGAPAFSVNVLAADQEALSTRFASQCENKFAGLAVTAGLAGVPLIAGCIANLECSRIAAYPGGDHEIVVGRVDGVRRGDGEPLLRYCGSYRRIAAIAPPPLATVAETGVK
ncbi:MAG: flavin reductase family protein [Rhodospirillales bacterium]|jgi:flavin reductase (DIM6/NTAB) family NADH-FMN oxidoreductase RutF|nr:flavin reductase family protein [Rhodospirillales bacterium]